MTNLALFYSVSKKYESILADNAAQHVKMCMHPIDLIFVVCGKNVDQELIIKSITDKISNVEVKTITEDQAADKIGYNHTTDYKIRYDGYMLMIASKLHADVLTERDNIIITDPDNLLLKPTYYFKNSKPILYYSDPFTAHFDKVGKEIFGAKEFNYDFMTEKLLVQKSFLISMRKFMGNAIGKFSYSRHSWYDITEEEYKILAGTTWPQYTSWENLPNHIQDEIKQMIEPKLLPTKWKDYFADYMMYGYYVYYFHRDSIELLPTKIQNGPWGDGTADIFLNRPSENNSIDAFKYICNNLNTKYTY